MKPSVAIHWFRRDLRLEDNASLHAALRSGHPVLPIFIFDRHILDALEDRSDKRVAFIHQEVGRLNNELARLGSTLHTWYGKPEEVWKQLLDTYDIRAVYANRDYEPYARERDQRIHALLAERGIVFHGAKDHVIFDRNEIVKPDGQPYTVFTPYSRKWKSTLNEFYLRSYPTERYFDRWLQTPSLPVIPLSEMGFTDPHSSYPPREIPSAIIEAYAENRDIPSVRGTSRLSLHLRFGTVSIRTLSRFARAHSEKWLDELIWRDFYQAILYHFPQTTDHAFKPAYDRIEWLNDPGLFDAWKEGRTGYPIVDAGMRELNETGFMHNRVRMVTASFLTKHLLIDWRWGERYFAGKLLDYDLASNAGGWQWAAGCGCDAAPYFRIFNPTSQQEKFDPQARYIRQWVPEYGTPSYPRPIVDHAFARERCLRTFKQALEA